jgi:hypothetical protein
MVPKLGLLFAGAITFFLSAQISNAQSEQPFVLACAAENYNPDIKIKLTINLANGTVSIEDTNPYKTDTTQAAVKQVTDQKITFNSTTGVTYVLDRYTGHMSFMANGNNLQANCQRSQKQF